MSIRISDVTPAPDPSPVGPASGAASNNSPVGAQAGAEDAANLSPLSRLAEQASAADPERVAALRRQFQSGQYMPDAQKTSLKMVEEYLDNPLER